MKKLILVFCATLLSLSTQAQSKKLGLGVILGDPTGLSLKSFLSKQTALDAGISYGHNELLIFGDYLRHFPGKFGRQNAFVAALSPYIGVGPIFAFGDDEKHDHKHFIEDDDDDFAFGGRIPLGVEWLSTEIPLGVSLEIVPGLAVFPETDGFVQAGLGIRFYF